MDFFVQKLREERKSRDYTLNKMAEELGIPVTTYKHYEEFGRSGIEPPYETLVKIADIFDVSVDYLLGRNEV